MKNIYNFFFNISHKITTLKLFLYLQLQPRLLRVQFEKNYPECNSDDAIMGPIKINDNIPVSPYQWIYEQDINPVNFVLAGTCRGDIGNCLLSFKSR